MRTTITWAGICVAVSLACAASSGAAERQPQLASSARAHWHVSEVRAQLPNGVGARQRADQRARERERLARRRQERLDARQGPEYTETFSRTVRVGRDATFELSNVAGDVFITGGSSDDIRIAGTKRVRHPSETQARVLLRAIGIQVLERTGFVRLRTEIPRRRNWPGRVDFTISLPASTTVSVRTLSGDLRVTNVDGELRAETLSGDILASSTGRVSRLRAMSGDIQVRDAGGSDLAIGTVGGDVTVRNLRARSVEIESVSGDLRFANVESERVRLRSISGDIEYAGALAARGRYDFQSHSGDIIVSPEGAGGFDLDASTLRGDARADFSLTPPDTAPDGDHGPPRPDRTVRGAFGDAGAILTLRSFSGDVLIRRLE